MSSSSSSSLSSSNQQNSLGSPLSNSPPISHSSTLATESNSNGSGGGSPSGNDGGSPTNNGGGTGSPSDNGGGSSLENGGKSPPSNNPPPESISNSSSPSPSPSPPPSEQSSGVSPPPNPPPSSSSPPPANNSPPPPLSPPPSDSDNNNSLSPPSPLNSPSPPPPSSRNNSSPPSPPPPYSPPPPPSHPTLNGSRNKSPPSPQQSSSHPSRSNNSPSPPSGISQDKAIIAGIAAGAVLLLIILLILCIVACAKRKKRKSPHNTYFGQNSVGNGNKMGNYYNNTQHANWNASRPSMDQTVKIAPGNSYVSSEHNWPIAPPPPPPMMSSSELNSAGFSGPHQAPIPPPHPALALGFNKSTFTYGDLAAATGGFANSNLLGQGGFGYVHKGVLPNGKEIAVKSLKSGSGQGEREFQAEVDIISRVHHRHLVSLVGYCIAGSQRMLVYEYVPNNSLEYHLFGEARPTMDWSTRVKIALGAAKGFAYLHEDCHPRIIHRDIKGANILLDYNFEAKVADFGLAKLSSDNHTHVSTRIMGTFGYLAPEYASSGKLTEKSDVYSYGVMLLEMITGKRAVDICDDDESLVDWARPHLMNATENGDYEELVDLRLGNNYDHQEMLRMVHCAATCIRHSAKRRPKMSQIVRALEGDAALEDLHEGMKPGHSAIFGSSSGDYDGSNHSNIEKFRPKGGMSSTEFTSSEHAATGEFVHHSGGESQEMHRMRSP